LAFHPSGPLIRRLRPQTASFFLRTRIPRVCEAHALRAFKIRKLLLALLLIGAASLENALRVCVALRARERATPPFPPSNFLHSPRPCASISDPVDLPQHSFAVIYLDFDIHDIAMPRSNMSGTSKLNGSLTGALRTTMLLAAMASTSAPVPPVATFDLPWYPSMFSKQQLVGGGGGDAGERAVTGAKGRSERAEKAVARKKAKVEAGKR
jgi:hypothetical protein